MESNTQNNLSLKNNFVHHIESKIISGELKLGSKLPPERELAKQMGISKTAVNSGIADMAKKGFLEIKPRQGTYVANYKKYGNIDVILSIMDNNNGLLPTKDIRSFLEMRYMLEELAFKTLLPKITDEEIASLKLIVDKLSNSKSDTEAIKINYDIHHEICYMSGNTISPLLFSYFKIPILNMWKKYCDTFGRDKMIDNAKQLHQLIKTRDVTKTLKFFEEFLNESYVKM